MLTDGHRPDGFDQRVAGIPRVDNQAGLSESPFGHCSSAQEERNVYPAVQKCFLTKIRANRGNTKLYYK